MTAGPLSGVRVVAVEQAVAVPFATRQLADMGAEVIKVERPDGGDFARGYDSAIRGGLSTHFAWLNRGKKSITLDLRKPDGARTLSELIARSDVVVQNLGPGAFERLGFSAEHLRAQHPSLVVAELTGYGDAGPMRSRKAFDLLVQAEAGVVSITGTPESPAKTGIPIADIAAGSFLVQGILGALVARARTGEGDILRLSLFDALVEWMGYPVYRQLYHGSPPPRSGLAHPTVVPYDAYPTADGQQVLIGVQNDRGWTALVDHVIGEPALLTDDRTSTNIARCDNRGLVDEIVARSTSRLTAAELLERLDAAGVPAGRVNTVADVIDHPQLVERDRWSSVDSPVGEIRAIRPPVVSSAYTPELGAIPALGQHTAEVLAWLDGARGRTS
jgi:crotonobetainyl-CoA:carnitine CoA-transferase CaiB-like acyl-CoA transferase